MAETTIDVACPKCKKKMKAPAAIKGKKIRCKGCGEAFEAVDLAQHTEEEWGVIRSYGVGAVKEGARCPFCAWELENDDDIICLHCGYNLVTRERIDPRILHPVTGGDYFLWLLPGIICVLVALFFVGVIVCAWTRIPDLDGMGLGFIQSTQWGAVYTSVISGFIAWGTGYFAFRRLVLYPHPPDKEKPRKKEKELE